MRELKFRVWDIEKKEFFKPIYEGWKGNIYDLSITISGEIMRRTMQYPAEHESCFPYRYEIMQFTGLKDKNGKNIYEGDIIIHKYLGDEITHSVIEFFRCEYCAKSLEDPTVQEAGYLGLNSCENIEVIGNTYENPELIIE